MVPYVSEAVGDDIVCYSSDYCHFDCAFPDSVKILEERKRRERKHQDEKIANVLKDPLMRLCAQYLLNAKRRGKQALDPVANFHLTNGARVERLNWLGDTSPNGLSQSLGLMVNYLYELDRIEENHESYTGEGSVTASAAVHRLI